MTQPPRSAQQAAQLGAVLADARRHRQHRWLWVLLVLIAAAASVYYYFGWRDRPTTPRIEYIGAEVTQDRLIVKVTATGTLEPLKQIDVGTEVSGLVEEVLVDFNDAVSRGQVLARLDTQSLNAMTIQARGSLAAAQGRLREAEATVIETQLKTNRCAKLASRQMCSTDELDATQAALARAEATVSSAEGEVAVAKATLQERETDLAKAVIRSPIDGIVLDRKVERGQTVTAGFQTPEMFVIASDLARLELTVDIDEADIGEVALNQDATFTVDAFPAQIFDAKVAELRNAAKTVSNVVTYQGVLQVDNSKRLLKPGMTATTDIVVKVATNVMTVPNGALRFSPQTQSETTLVPQSTTAPVDPIAAGKGEVWNLGADGKPVSRKVTLGVTDGRRTQVTSTNVKAGEELILDIAQPGRAAP